MKTSDSSEGYGVTVTLTALKVPQTVIRWD